MTTSQILVIEDDHDIRVSFRQALENCGYHVYTVANGVDALNLLKKIAPPKLIVLDLGMPLMNGEEFLKIKSGDQALRDIPTLVVSCHIDRMRALSETRSLPKPVDIDHLVSRVKEALVK